MTSFLSHHPLHTFLSSSNLPLSPKPRKPFTNTLIYATSAIPPRDRVIDFGKYKGKMLGTLPSTYLKWVSNNLRARDFEEWANLADQVLRDPVYNDRLEWEFAQKLLNGDILTLNSSKSDNQGAVAELLEISQRFGWDNEDKVGWSKVDFQLLGTSKGGRIPRVKEGRERESKRVEEREVLRGERNGGRRGERRERLKVKRGMTNIMKGTKVDDNGDGKSGLGSYDRMTEVYNPFPGRETLLRKALDRKSIR